MIFCQREREKEKKRILNAIENGSLIYIWNLDLCNGHLTASSPGITFKPNLWSPTVNLWPAFKPDYQKGRFNSLLWIIFFSISQNLHLMTVFINFHVEYQREIYEERKTN